MGKNVDKEFVLSNEAQIPLGFDVYNIPIPITCIKIGL